MSEKSFNSRNLKFKQENIHGKYGDGLTPGINNFGRVASKIDNPSYLSPGVNDALGKWTTSEL